MGAGGVRFQTDAENLALHGIHYAGNLFLKDLIITIPQPHTGPQSIHRDLLGSVGSPVVDHAFLTGALGKIAADFPACLIVVDPETANILIRRGQRTVCLLYTSRCV